VLLREFRQKGYDAVPVNPETREMDGQRALPACKRSNSCRRRSVDDAAVAYGPVVRDCAEAGIKRVWMYAHRQGAVSADAVKFCEANGISVIAGECPMMFLPRGLVPSFSRIGEEDRRSTR